MSIAPKPSLWLLSCHLPANQRQPCFWFFHRTKLGSTHPTCSTVSLLSLGCVEGKCSVYCKASQSKENGQLKFKAPRVRERVVGGRGQLMCSSLIGWWWANGVMFLESQPSTLWFHSLQGLCACRQHAVNFFRLVGVLVSAQQLKNVAQNIICSPWGGTEGPWLCFMAKLILFHLAWLFPFGFVFLWIKFALWNLGKAWEAKAFLQTIGKVHEGWGVLSPASPHRVLLSRSLPPEISVACGCFRAGT